MSKEILRDKNGRFVKKSDGIGISRDDYITKMYSGKWFLRELDYRPEPLDDYVRKNHCEQFINDGRAFVFDTKEEAVDASNKVRELLKSYVVNGVPKGSTREFEDKLARLTEERDEARKEVDRRNTRVHILMKENDILLKLCSELIDCTSWWKRRKHDKEVRRLAKALQEVNTDAFLDGLVDCLDIIKL